MCLGLAVGQAGDASVVQVAACRGELAQLWRPELAVGDWRIVALRNLASGATLGQHLRHRRPDPADVSAQRVLVVPHAAVIGYCELEATWSGVEGSVVDVDRGSVSAGAGVILWRRRPDGAPRDNELFSLQSALDGPLVHPAGIYTASSMAAEQAEHSRRAGHVAFDDNWRPPLPAATHEGQPLLAASCHWGEAQERRAAEHLFVQYAGGRAQIRRGQSFYVDHDARILVGWHGTVSPPRGMDGESMIAGVDDRTG